MAFCNQNARATIGRPYGVVRNSSINWNFTLNSKSRPTPSTQKNPPTFIGGFSFFWGSKKRREVERGRRPGHGTRILLCTAYIPFLNPSCRKNEFFINSLLTHPQGTPIRTPAVIASPEGAWQSKNQVLQIDSHASVRTGSE